MKPGGGIVGPVPEGADASEYDRLRRRVLWAMPSGLYVLGARAGERRNGMTINWVTQLSFEPKLLGVGVETTAFTHELVVEGRVFSLNLLDRADRAVVRKFTKPVEVDAQARTMNGFGYRDGVSGAPVLTSATAYLDCRLHRHVELGSHSLFVGEVIDAGFHAEEETPVLRMEDTRMNYGG